MKRNNTKKAKAVRKIVITENINKKTKGFRAGLKVGINWISLGSI